jgi:colanic acid biosynthesis glycosyl transferase WcaI
MNKRIIYVAQYFTPEPYLKDITFIKDLKSKGWDPIVITSFPNYPKGQIYKGFKNSLFTVQILEGIKVVRVLTFPYHGSNAFKRIFNYLIFSIFSSIALFRYGKPSSFYYILQSSPFVIINAWTVRLFKWNSKILLDIQDIFPENIRISGFIRSNIVLTFIDFVLNKFYYRSFDLFVVVSNSFKEILINKRLPEKKIKVVYNWSLVESENPDSISEEISVFSNRSINVVYAGNIGVNQGLSRLKNGFAYFEGISSVIKFHFFGDGTDFEKLHSSLKIKENVVFHGRKPPNEIGQYLAGADVLLLHLVKDPAYCHIIPSKLQAYIQFRKPILAGLEGEARNIVESNGLGEVFEPENQDEFIKSLNRIILYDDIKLRQVKERSRELYDSEFSREAGVNKINQFILGNYEC